MLAALPFPEFHPALFTLPRIELGGFALGPLPLRWYALAYIAGIFLGWRYALYLVRRPQLFGGRSPATNEDLDDLIFWAMIGIILGGRLGYVFFYLLPFDPGRVASDPLTILRVWEGGMSFHGGLIGVAVALVTVAKARGIDLLRISDVAGVVAPIGLLFGRTANFINAELYGRHTTSPLGVVFPEGRANSLGAPDAYNWEAREWVYTGEELPRHPSQLYEAGLEGLLLLIVLSVVVFRFGAFKRPGLVAGLFLLGYGITRSFAENFREPDAHIGFLPGGITMGMLLSLPMWIGGAWLVWRAYKSPPVEAAPAK
ncbi:MAG: prolipoprotein diacylglyceryl transferase [Pseudomonadota bacterium]